MDDLQRLKILLYQYILFKSDYYKEQAEKAHYKLKVSKSISSDQFYDTYLAIIRYEMFEIVQRDISNILNSFR